ncbi:MAG TPA: hypothetical protein VJS30_15450 [Paraburkholderia sp.]|nr:hypothetical protein [Paraburkholderia sp.]
MKLTPKCIAAALAGIFGFGDDAAMAAAVAGKSAGNHVKVIGFDGMPEARAAVDKIWILLESFVSTPKKWVRSRSTPR